VKLSDIASAVGTGLFAGLAGTAAMTASSTLETKLRDRSSSSAPADAAGKVLGVQPRDDAGEARFATFVHWAYGTSWGAARGLVELRRPSSAAGTAQHWAAVWGSSLVTLPALGVAPPFWKSGAQEAAIDAFHHLIYAIATGAAYRLIDD
jgi:hypothetical protein